ncbi:hypothetical protein AOLI_G00317380 [Acnodon oligacanthus]
MVRQLVEGPCTAQKIFAGCCSPEEPWSKAGLNMLTVCAALELKKDVVLCTALHLGWVRTETGGEQNEGKRK